ncbi:hypothetical protein PIB30_000103 [Stylosanthes scabra]|uniref:Uncharacterized protein n=1 Tax=Stylosanthes scabra TaxID=79078 RepID=A0ABU6R2L6_9FABA|nr:hypothetical protein [Stylosanthes scabra]
MGKKRSCQNVKVPHPLNEVENRFYGWVEEAVLETAGSSDRVPFRADEGSPHFLWVYQELFTRLRVRFLFSDFQRDVMTRCRVAVSQLHLNGWGFILTFERVCLHNEFRPTIRLFFYIYDVLIPPTGFGYISFRARQGRKLRAFWLDHENNLFPWVYWNPEVKDFTVYNLEPLEMAAFIFLVSLPAGLPKRNKFTCRWILDSSDAEVGKFLDDLLDAKMKKSKLDHLMAMMADPSRMAPSGSTPAESSSRRLKKQSAKCERPKVVNLGGEEEAKENPSADLRRKRQRKKGKEDDAFDQGLGEDSSWEHKVNPIDVAFPKNFNYLKALDAGLTSGSVRESLVKIPPEQLLGESYHYSAKSLAYLQVGVETALVAKVKAEKELSAALDQVEILKGERDLALAFLPFKEKADSLNDQLS